MPFDAGLAERLKAAAAHSAGPLPGLVETRMFGGFGYLLNGNMCVGIHKDTLIVRVGTETSEALLREPHIRPMDLTGRVMKGWVTAEAEAVADDAALARLFRLAVAFVGELPAKSK